VSKKTLKTREPDTNINHFHYSQIQRNKTTDMEDEKKIYYNLLDDFSHEFTGLISIGNLALFGHFMCPLPVLVRCLSVFQGRKPVMEHLIERVQSLAYEQNLPIDPKLSCLYDALDVRGNAIVSSMETARRFLTFVGDGSETSFIRSEYMRSGFIHGPDYAEQGDDRTYVTYIKQSYELTAPPRYKNEHAFHAFIQDNEHHDEWVYAKLVGVVWSPLFESRVDAWYWYVFRSMRVEKYSAEDYARLTDIEDEQQREYLSFSVFVDKDYVNGRSVDPLPSVGEGGSSDPVDLVDIADFSGFGADATSVHHDPSVTSTLTRDIQLELPCRQNDVDLTTREGELARRNVVYIRLRDYVNCDDIKSMSDFERVLPVVLQYAAAKHGFLLDLTRVRELKLVCSSDTLCARVSFVGVHCPTPFFLEDQFGDINDIGMYVDNRLTHSWHMASGQVRHLMVELDESMRTSTMTTSGLPLSIVSDELKKAIQELDGLRCMLSTAVSADVFAPYLVRKLDEGSAESCHVVRDPRFQHLLWPYAYTR